VIALKRNQREESDWSEKKSRLVGKDIKERVIAQTRNQREESDCSKKKYKTQCSDVNTIKYACNAKPAVALV
jgi:hypothetical protein